MRRMLGSESVNIDRRKRRDCIHPSGLGVVVAGNTLSAKLDKVLLQLLQTLLEVLLARSPELGGFDFGRL